MFGGRPEPEPRDSPEDREQLLRWRCRRTTSNSLARHADILLRCADGVNNREVAAQLKVSGATVGKWRRRYISRGPGLWT